MKNLIWQQLQNTVYSAKLNRLKARADQPEQAQVDPENAKHFLGFAALPKEK